MAASKKNKVVNGLNVISYFKTPIGLGEAGRLIVSSLQSQSVPYNLLSSDFLAEGHYKDSYELPLSKDFVHPINFFGMDHSQIPFFIEKCGWHCFKDRYNIAFWYWETNIIPKWVRSSWPYLDELWVSTRYLQEHLSIASNIPVYRIPQAVEFTHLPKKVSKKDFNLEDKFTFLFCFSFSSVLERKNPLAVVDAFRKAFPNRHDVQLVIKSQYGHLYPRQLKYVLDYIKDDPRIIWMDGSMEAHRRYELMNMCDCYVSLHRSEGFGFTMAEAMLLGKPVIATGYSGNLDFMTEENSFLCSYKLIPVGPGVRIYPSTGIWADVDTDHAAYWMDYVVNNPAEASAKAKKGKEFIQQHHSHDAVGRQIVNRLQQITPSQTKSMPWQYQIVKVRQSRYLFPLRYLWRLLKKGIKKIVR